MFCHFKANRWEAAHKLASSYMSESEVRVLYMEQAQKMEAAGSLLEAEKLFLQVGEVKLLGLTVPVPFFLFSSLYACLGGSG